MTFSDKSRYFRVRFPKGEALERLQEEAAYYGKSEGELIADVALAWTKMLKGEWNFHWPLALPMPPMLAGQATSGTLPVAETTPAAQREAEARAAREEAERKQRERREARLAAARAELLD